MNRQYTIRNVSSELDAKVRAKAARERIPLNTALLKLLHQSLEKNATRKLRHHDFDDLAGRWVEDPAFDAAMQDMRRIDDRDWQ